MTEDTTPVCQATKPHGPGTPPLIRTSCSSTQHQSQPPQFHSGPPANQPRSQRYIIARGRPEASSLHGNAALHRSHHSIADEDYITARKPQIKPSQTVLCKTLISIIYVCGTVVVILVQTYSTSIYIYIYIYIYTHIYIYSFPFFVHNFRLRTMLWKPL